MSEQGDRIEQNTSGEASPAVALQLRFTSHAKAEEVLARTRQVMQLIAGAQDTEWPTDEEWKRRLPDWFLGSFTGYSADQLMANPNLWDFGSWLHVMKYPGWEWWSSIASDKTGSVRCVAYAEPYAIEPLSYLLRSAGASDVEFEEK